MKKTIAIVLFGTLPVLALASGDHAGGHDMHSGHKMESMMQDSHDVHDMSAHGHEADAGRPGEAGRVNRTIKVTMADTMRFDPAEMKFKSGETVRFLVSNLGKIRHEMVIGSMEELKEHADMMRKMPGMKHEDANMISLASGESGELIWQFDKTGTFDFACLVPGHLEAGMTGKIRVE